ncbi:translocation/assembly module TamB domain-containing protein [Gloeothece verrucosa]|uniref:translocation/assembly module TamB domain-containing protein n=1 Tax=Gloeothece verrucosa TaxID=2546359 RepID=UPI0003193966|nr:translocation/assembly module TamB [Gloeothece verrucosa]
MLVSITGGLVYGRFVIEQQLAPILEKELSDFLNRPVKIGSVEGISLTGVRFGKSEILPTPTDPAKISLAEVDVSFNPVKFFSHSQLTLDVKAIRPNIYLEQGVNGSWLMTPFDVIKSNGSQEGAVELESLQFINADVVLRARSATKQLNSAVKLFVPSLKTNFANQGRIVDFVGVGLLAKGGKAKLSGVAKTNTGEINLVVLGHSVQAADLKNLIALPLNLKNGEVGGNLEVHLKPKQLPSLKGVATLANVTAQIPQLPQAFAQTNGLLRFNDHQIKLEGVTTQFGKIAAVTNGTINLKGNYALSAKTLPFQVQDALSTLKIPASSLPISAQLQSQFQVNGTLNNPQVSLNLVTTKPAVIDKINFQSFQANLQLFNSQIHLTQFKAIPTAGGELSGKGTIIPNSSTFAIDVNANKLPSKEIAALYQSVLPSLVGQVSGQLTVSGKLNQLNSWKGRGTVSIPFGQGLIKVNNIEYLAGNWQGKLQASGIALDHLGINLPENIAHGRVNAQLNLSGNQNSFSPETIVATGEANLSLADGQVKANNIRLAQGEWKTNLLVERLKINQFVPNLPHQLNGRLGGNFTVTGDLNSTLADIQGSGQAHFNLPSGTIKANQLEIHQGFWQATLKTDNLQLANLIPNLSTPLRGKLQGQLSLEGNLESRLEDIQGTGYGSLISSAGTIAAKHILIKGGKFESLITPEQVQLASFSPQFKGFLGGKLNISGNINNLNPTAIKAEGNLNFSQGLSLINRALTTTVAWSGKRLDILQATASDFNAKGFLEMDLSSKNPLSAINKLDLNVSAKGFDLKQLTASFSQAQQWNIGGRLNFEGKIAGTPQKPHIDGAISLNNLSMAHENFEPELKGAISLVPDSGVKLQLAGDRDKIELSLNENYQPLSFALNLDQIAVEGTYREQQILISANNIPLELLTEIAKDAKVPISEKILSQPLGGELSGNFAFNTDNHNFNGEQVAIANPRWGHIQGDHFSGNISINNGDFSLTQGQLKRNNSSYNINANVTQSPSGPRLYTEVAVTGGKIEEVLETLQIFELSDLGRGIKAPTYAKAKDLWNEPPQTTDNSSLYSVGLPYAPLAQQLKYFTQFNQHLEKSAQEQNNNPHLPQLSSLKGEFDAKLTLDASSKTGVAAKFDLLGKGWQWGKHNFKQLQVQGDYQNGLLNLEPVSIQLENSLVAFSGHIGSQSQAGKLHLQNVPLDLIKQFVSVAPSVEVEGLLNGEVTLGGKRDNPEIQGQLAIAQATVNKIPLQATEGKFTYQNSRLDFEAGSQLTNQENAPIDIKGSLPYQLPFAKVAPSSDDLNLNIRVQNDGLAILNVLSQGQVSWIGGKGEINLDVEGQFDQQRGRPSKLQANGVAKLENASLLAQIFPKVPLTQVNGKIVFNFDQIQVEKLTGKFSGGKITAAGTLPILLPIPVKQPLTVTANNLTLNLKGLYQGDVNGTLQIAGSLLNPNLGGQVNLFNGQILLAEAMAEKENQATSPNKLATLTGFKNLQLNLGDNVWISFAPVLRILAAGNVHVNGNLAQPQPEGDIKLKGGQVNLFSAQFGLVGGEVNTARFMPDRGLDPYLDVQMTAVVSETKGNLVRSNPLSSEINDNTAFPSDSLQTVRVQAKVDGFASQITKNLQVTSLPPRSQTEIIALLGGNFINPVLEKDPRLGLANLAGSAVFGTIQGPISKVLGLSDFRVYPTQLLNPKDRIANYQIGIAAEASVDLRDNLSFSVQKIVNTDRPANFGLRYRINNNMVIRGTSNFSDDNRGMLEYQKRF